MLVAFVEHIVAGQQAQLLVLHWGTRNTAHNPAFKQLGLDGTAMSSEVLFSSGWGLTSEPGNSTNNELFFIN